MGVFLRAVWLLDEYAAICTKDIPSTLGHGRPLRLLSRVLPHSSSVGIIPDRGSRSKRKTSHGRDT